MTKMATTTVEQLDARYERQRRLIARRQPALLGTLDRLYRIRRRALERRGQAGVVKLVNAPASKAGGA